MTSNNFYNWIKVSDALPENDHYKDADKRQRYLVRTTPYDNMFVAYFGDHKGDYWYDTAGNYLSRITYKTVTHWMPLPPLD